jgi:hypothetical protein
MIIVMYSNLMTGPRATDLSADHGTALIISHLTDPGESIPVTSVVLGTPPKNNFVRYTSSRPGYWHVFEASISGREGGRS